MQAGEKVKLNPTILEDESRKRNHFLYSRIMEDDLEGEVVGPGQTLYHKGWWVKFYYGSVLIEENHIIAI